MPIKDALVPELRSRDGDHAEVARARARSGIRMEAA